MNAHAFDADCLGALYADARDAEDRGDLARAAPLFRACLAMDPDDHCGVSLRLAGHGLQTLDAAPAAYVATLFDQHAETFDQVLVDALHYHVPALARTLYGTVSAGEPAAGGTARAIDRMLDLGCGTGLAGVAFADVADEITGVDLAEGMLARADDRDVYADLYVGEAVRFMAEWDEAPFDLVVAADVWPYLGDLSPFAAAAARCLRQGGILIASSERGTADRAVGRTQRFQHSTAYLRDVLTSAGFDVRKAEPIEVRLEEGAPVPGDLILAQI